MAFAFPLGTRPGRGRMLAVVGLAMLVITLLVWLMVTSARPLVPQPPAPSAADVGAGRAAYRQLRDAKGHAGQFVILGAAELAGFGAVASHGFRPDRLSVATSGSLLRIEASHRLPLGRWLNVTANAQGPSAGFPPTQVKVGALTVPPVLSRPALRFGLWLVRIRRPDIPPLDRLVRDFSVRNGNVIAKVSLPSKSGLVDAMAGALALPVDSAQVVRIYCDLADQQRRQPAGELAEQVRRAFSMERGDASQVAFNRSAFVALGMLLVDDRVADFAGSARAQVARCRVPTVRASIYGRPDWTKHWALSAALAVGAGVQLSEAAGEWKELADSLARGSQVASGDPGGFSMADLAADRAGFETARAAIQPDSAERVAGKLAKVTSQQLLPHDLIEHEDGLSDPEFRRRYGGIDDPRFRARIGEIDKALAATGLR